MMLCGRYEEEVLMLNGMSVVKWEYVSVLFLRSERSQLIE